MRANLRQQAILLRKQGRFYSEIALQLGVAKSTAYAWTYNLDLDNDQRSLISSRLVTSKRQNVKKLAILKSGVRLRREAEVRSKALDIVGNAKLTLDHKRLVCALLFWCEGGKDVAAGIQFINSDPLMVAKFLSLLREAFPVQESKFRALVHLHDYHDPTAQLAYWSEITQIPLLQFHKSYIKPHTGKNIRPGYPGCISVRYLEASLGRLLKAIFIEYSKTT